MKAMNSDVMGIPEFYSNKSVFVTGSTGFIGKVLLEKLLRSCPNIGSIYILVRPKRGLDVHERVKEMFKSQLFDRLREEQPGFKDKVIPVHGDITEPGLGLNQTDKEMVISAVSIVFHSAATVKFDEPLKVSIQMNVLGVKKILELCHQMKKLEAVVHVSTAYCNCDKDVIMETIYPPPLLPHNVIDAAEWMTDDIVEMLTPLIVKPRPNTYTFTKAMAEYILQKERGLLPCAIIRPSIVGAALLEPYPGWVDNYNGPSGMLIAIGRGILRTMHGNTEATCDIIPVDLATNLIIAAAWSLAIERPSNVPVYNCTTGQLNRLTWGQMERASHKYFLKTPVNKPIRIPNPCFTRSKICRTIYLWLDHYLPAWIMDVVLWLQGKQPQMTKVQNRLWRSVKMLEYFTSRQWVFTSQNVLDLSQKLYAEDQQAFNFDVTRIDWPHYLENYCLGVKKYVLKESMDTIEDARRALNRLYVIRRFVTVTGFFIMWCLIMPRFAIARRLWRYIISLAVKILQRIPGFARS